MKKKFFSFLLLTSCFINFAVYANEEENNDILDQIRNMRGEIEKLQHENQLLEQRLKKIEESNTVINTATATTIASKENNSEVKTSLLNEKNISSTSSSNPSCAAPITKKYTKGEREAYNEAYALLEPIIKGKSYSQESIVNVRNAFVKFIQDYNKSALIGNAYYWIGQTYTVQKNYNSAANNYLKGYKANPKGEKAEDNLVRLTESLSNIKDKNQEVCLTISKLYKEFPKQKESTKNIIKKINTKIKCTN